MESFKILWRGIRDVYDSFVYFIVVSIAFWLCCAPMLIGYGFLAVGPLVAPLFLITAILVPPALATLFVATDPRRVVNRLDWQGAIALMKSSFLRTWRIALITIVPLVILAWNIAFFAGSGHYLEVLVPLWFVMWFFLFVLTFYCFSLAGTQESGLRNAFRGSMYVLVKFPFRSLLLGVIILIFGYMLTIAVLPMLVIGPSFFGAIVNRFVFAAFEVEVIDPDTPTSERASEHERGINPERRLIDRVLRRDGK